MNEACNLALLADTFRTTCITHTGNPAFIDHLSFTLPETTEWDAFLEVALDVSFQELTKAPKGLNGYLERYHYDNITVLTKGGAKGMGHNITLSGKACTSRQKNLSGLIEDVFSCNGRFTRCDLAIDDFDGVVNVDTIQQSIASGLVVSRLNTLKEYNQRDKSGNFTGRAAYFGSRKSDTFIRIYDKALQRGESRHWVRVELELKKGAANEALRQVLKGDLGEVAKGILNNSLSFRVKGEQKARSRWPIAPWWSRFLDGVERLNLVASKEDEADSQQRRLEWFMSHARTFAEMVDVCGFGIIPLMYLNGKGKLTDIRPTIH